MKTKNVFSKKMLFKKMAVGTMAMVLAISCVPVTAHAAEKFDANFYMAIYPDVVEALGTDPTRLYEHYLQYGQKEGRYPNPTSQPGAAVEGIAASSDSAVVALEDLPSLSQIRKKCTDEELQQAYTAALGVITPLIGKTKQEQVVGVAQALRAIYDRGMIYSMSNDHYNDPYGYLVLGTASCAGCARATIMCLEMLGIDSVEHVHPNQYCHQWARVKMDDGSYWISDAYGLYAGPEPAPYVHPYAQ